ncbi:glycosyltransferase family 2 protein [Candidatus Parcubacteria bacterium]|nr:glycosyltransferase family 2 protein [Candidatus Parcubacteria bacterium]
MSCLSIIIPVFNEEKTIKKILSKIENVLLINNLKKEIIIVDDCSDDGTREILKNFDKYKTLYHKKNIGKGMSIRTGLKAVSGDYVIIQDADLEYNPDDYNILLQKMIDEKLSVVYGSRELGQRKNKYSTISFYLGGIFLTKLANLLYKQSLTDEATCYKLFRVDLIKSLPLKCKRFEFCPEVTALISIKGIKIEEIGISYSPRHKKDGKKINYWDGLHAIWILFKYRF